MTNVFIYGSCVTRDIFNLSESRGFKVHEYYARSSMASLCSRPFSDETMLEKITSPFQRRMVERDFKKDLILAAEALQGSDLVIIDLIDERFDLIELPDGRVFTNSGIIGEHKLLEDSSFSGYRVIKNGSPEHKDMWLQGMYAFIKFVRENGKIDCTYVNKAYWAAKFDGDTSTKYPYGSGLVSEANKSLDWMYEHLQKFIDKSRFFELSSALFVADEKHRWGISPFHFSERYYRVALSQMIKARFEWFSRNINSMASVRVQSPLVSFGLTLSVSAKFVGNEVVSVCSLMLGPSECDETSFAFYLMVDGVRQAMRWYEPACRAVFPVSAEVEIVEVVVFYRDVLGEVIRSTAVVERA
ncbi:DUF6270 domain-containing protein [Pseudomonas sp. WOUb67]|uniref:DUF6270 domain-containing protein n=1 Tax=Pseudomonas sp. WOUb67 TaxID=3161136 RepID=UPI003CEB6D65